MNNSRGFAFLPALLGIIILAALIGGGAYVYEKSQYKTNLLDTELMPVASSTSVTKTTKTSTQTTSNPFATIDKNSLVTNVGHLTLAGSANVTTLFIEVDAADGTLAYSSGAYNAIAVTNSRWSADIGTFTTPGQYAVHIYTYDGHMLLLTQTLSVADAQGVANAQSALQVTSVHSAGPASITFAYQNLPKRTTAVAVCIDNGACTEWVTPFTPETVSGTHTISVQDGNPQSQKGLSAGTYKLVVIGSSFSDQIVASDVFTVTQ